MLDLGPLPWKTGYSGLLTVCLLLACLPRPGLAGKQISKNVRALGFISEWDK